MPFIGNQPALSYTSFAVQHFTTSATTSYTLDYSVANENEIRLVINNVVQQPGSSYAYTASGTTLTLSAATSATDTMYAVFLGKAVQTVTPASGSVTNGMLAGSIDLTSKVTGTLSVANGGTNLSSGFANGITMADQWRLSADTNQGINDVISTNWERVDETYYSSIGTGLTESSGVFTFPSTGIYYITMSLRVTQDSGDASSNIFGQFFVSSTANDAFLISCNNQGGTQNGTGSIMFNVTNTSTHKFRSITSSFSGTTRVRGNTGRNDSHFTVIRLGDSV